MVTGKEKKTFYFFLFNDGFLQTIMLPKGQYRYVEFYPLQYSSVLLAEGKLLNNCCDCFPYADLLYLGTRFDWTDGDQKSLCFNTTKNEASEWEAAMREQIDNLQETEIFGKTIKDILQRYPSETGIPFIIENLLEYIERNCTEISGVFRISGSATSINRTKNLINRGIHVDIDTLDNHVVTGLLKQFLREMEDTVIPVDRYDDFMKCNDQGNKSLSCCSYIS